MANKYIINRLTSLILRKMQIKTTRHYFTPIRMDIITKQKIINIGADVEKSLLLYTVSGNVNWYSHYRK